MMAVLIQHCRICCAPGDSSKTTSLDLRLIPHGSQFQIAWGIRLPYVFGVCLGERIYCHKECSGDYALSDVPVFKSDLGLLNVEQSNTHAIVMPVQVCFPLELFRARTVDSHGCAGVRIFPLWVVRLHVRFPIVASLEEFTADVAIVCCFLRGGPLALLLDAADTW